MSQTFTRRTTIILVSVVTASFGVAVAYSLFGDQLGVLPSTGSDAYSRSALGHKGFVNLLRKLDVPVVVSRHDSAGRAGDHSVLVVAEPSLGGDEQKQELSRMLEAPTVLLVLPKWYGEPDEKDRAYIVRAELLLTDEVDEVLDQIDIEGEVVRVRGNDLLTDENELDAEPSLGVVAQLISGTDLLPVVGFAQGILVGRVAGTTTYVLADPDVIANHGLGKGDNAAFAVLLIDLLRHGDDAAVVFDETLHGHVSPPGLWAELVAFPLVLATVSALLALLVMLWAAMGRFGKPTPPPPVIAPGKAFLIENTAELIRYAGHVGHALDSYFQATLADVARRSHVPSYVGKAELAGFLGRLAEARKVSIDLASLEREVAHAARADSRQAARALEVAARIHRFRQEMIDGSSDHSRRR